MGPFLSDLNLVAALAPRPLAIETGEQDELKLSDLVAVEDGARKIYAEREATHSLRIHRHAGSHEADVRSTAQWFQEALHFSR